MNDIAFIVYYLKFTLVLESKWFSLASGPWTNGISSTHIQGLEHKVVSLIPHDLVISTYYITQRKWIVSFSGRTKIRETRNCSCYIKHPHFIVRHLGKHGKLLSYCFLLLNFEVLSVICVVESSLVKLQNLEGHYIFIFVWWHNLCPFWAPKLILIMYGWSLVLHHSISYSGFFYNFFFFVLCFFIF